MTVRELISKLQAHIDRDPSVADLTLCIDEVIQSVVIRKDAIAFEIAKNVHLSVVR